MKSKLLTPKLFLVLGAVLLLGSLVRAAEPSQVASAKTFLTNQDRAKGALFFAHPTAAYRSAAVTAISDVVDPQRRPVPGAFAVTVRYTWKNLLDDTNTSDLLFFFNAKGRLTEVQIGATTSFFRQFTGADLVLDALKDELMKDVNKWQDAAARKTALTLIRNSDTRGLLTLILQMQQP
jgi:hypothetical protein